MQDRKKIFITGGGTGGHIYPAVAVADGLREENDIYYVGNPDNLEYDIVTKKGYKFLPVNVHGMPRKASVQFVFWGIQLACAVIKCMYYIKKYNPDAVFGTGGYVSAPALISAKLLSIPYIMHDCDANPGLVTRKLASDASGISLAFEDAKKNIPNKKCYINGNPIRMEFKTLSKQEARKILGLQDKLTICIMGGSQGAKSINKATVDILKTLSCDYDVQVIFQTGKNKYDEVKENLLQYYPDYASDKNIIVKPYFDDMVSVLKSSDIAVSRAGSLSISELCASGTASIFVPYPYAAADHQRINAKLMEKKGAGLYIEDADLNGETLLNMLVDLIGDRDKLKILQNTALSLAKYDGVHDIINQIKAVF